jgi:hypothetical protein
VSSDGDSTVRFNKFFHTWRLVRIAILLVVLVTILLLDRWAHLAASQSSSTFTISDISQSLSVTPAAIAGVIFNV